jgi:hypothetical protein
MSETNEVTSDLYADAQVILFLHNQDDLGLLKFIDTQYGSKFTMEQTGTSFEDCIDWCAQNAGGIDNAKRVLRLLFERYYFHLPKAVQADLLYLAEELEYDPRRTKLDELKALCRAEMKLSVARIVSLASAARALLRNVQLKRKLKERAVQSLPVGVPRFRSAPAYGFRRAS